MKKVDPEQAIDKKYPEWIVMVVTADEDGTPNAMPAGWCMFTSGDPTMMATSIGFERYTHNLLENSNNFVLAYPSKNQKEDVLYCGSHSGANVEKFEETDLEPVKASVVDAPLIEGSVACFECEKKGTLDTGDHTIFAGEVVAAHVTEGTEKIYTVEGWGEMGSDGFKTVSEGE